MKYIKYSVVKLALLMLVAGIAGSCNERSINPFEDETSLYSLYGALSMSADTNYVRIRKLDTPLFADSLTSLDATVTFTHLETGQSVVLSDTIVNFDGNFTRNFLVTEQLEIDSRYEITVERSDGARATSVATTPLVTIQNMEFAGPIQCETPIDFVYGNVRFPEYIQMEIGVEYQGQMHWALMEVVGVLRHRENADEMYVRMSPRNLLVEIFTPIIPDNPFFDRYRLFPTVSCNQLDTGEFFIRYLHYGPEWLPARRDLFTSPINIESGDVENGLGFVGAYRIETFSFSLE